MKINTTPKLNNFGSRPIYPIKLKQLVNNTYKTVDGYFSELSPTDFQDWEAIYNIHDKWHRANNNYTRKITESFQEPSPNIRYFATELKNGSKNLCDKLTSILKLTNPQATRKEDFSVLFIQAAPDIAARRNLPPIKGAGALGMYGAVKLAQDNGFKKVEVISANNPFYDSLGIPHVGTEDGYGLYELPASQYADFLERISKKYSLNPTKQIIGKNHENKL